MPATDKPSEFARNHRNPVKSTTHPGEKRLLILLQPQNIKTVRRRIVSGREKRPLPLLFTVGSGTKKRSLKPVPVQNAGAGFGAIDSGSRISYNSSIDFLRRDGH